MEILPATPADRAAAIALWEACGLTRPWNDPVADFDRALNGPASTVLVGRIADPTDADAGADADSAARWAHAVAGAGAKQIVATAMVGSDGHRGWVYYLAVAPELQACGLGRAMMAACDAWLRERGIPKIHLLVRDSNAPVLGFYAALGYEPQAVRVLGRWLGGESPVAAPVAADPPDPSTPMAADPPDGSTPMAADPPDPSAPVAAHPPDGSTPVAADPPDPVIRAAFAGWPLLNSALRDAVAGLTAEQLNQRPAPDHWPLWAIVGHLACQRVFWLCDFAGEPRTSDTPFPDAAWTCPGDEDLDHVLSGADLAAALDATFAVVSGALDRWTMADLAEPIRRDWGDDPWIKTRGDVIARVLAHDTSHAAEASLALGLLGLPALDIWP